MLELDFNDVEKFKENLVGRKLTFQVERKRNETSFLVNGKKIAKANQKNSVNTANVKNKKLILNIFASVKKSINRYLEKCNFTYDKKEKIYDSSFINRILFDELPNGSVFYYIDVKHCYWRIAYLNGYISESYYNKILKDPELKLYRNMALSCIIAPRIIDYYENNNQAFPHYAQILKDKDYVYESNYAPHDIEVTEFSSGRSRREVAYQMLLWL